MVISYDLPNRKSKRVGEMADQIGALTALPVDSALIPSTHPHVEKSSSF